MQRAGDRGVDVMMPKSVLDGAAIAADLDADGYAVVRGWFDVEACTRTRAFYGEDARYRSTVTMERHGYGRGEYRYFGYPLPDEIADARGALYTALAPIANAWMQLALSADAGQVRPTALILRYRDGDYNALHQDVYGELAFPLQGTVLLSDSKTEFRGGEFVLVENRTRMQSVAHVVPLERGDLVIFPNRDRARADGPKSIVRHGVARVRSGERFTLGLILHDAK